MEVSFCATSARHSVTMMSICLPALLQVNVMLKSISHQVYKQILTTKSTVTSNIVYKALFDHAVEKSCRMHSSDWKYDYFELFLSLDIHHHLLMVQ